MQAAATDLGIHLQVLYAERVPEKMLEQARAVLQGPQPPDYLVFVNEQYGGPEILRLSKGTQVKLFAVSSTLTPDQQSLIGQSREQYPNWIGSLVPNDEEAGYIMASGLIEQAQQANPRAALQMLAFSGVKQTPAAQLRERGLQRALAEHPQVRLQQLVNSEWNRQRAYEQAQVLLPRYPAPEGEDPASYLRRLTEQGLRRRYGDPPPASAIERLEGELEVIGELGFESYFLIVWDFVRFAKDSGIAVGPGRALAELLLLVLLGLARLILGLLPGQVLGCGLRGLLPLGEPLHRRRHVLQGLRGLVTQPQSHDRLLEVPGGSSSDARPARLARPGSSISP
jgi:hypothetical protein